MQTMVFVKENNFEEINTLFVKGYKVKQIAPVSCPQETSKTNGMEVFYGAYVYLEK